MKNYGYKVCYREDGKKRYVRYFLTYPRKQAADAMDDYIRYPPTARTDGHILKSPVWKIKIVPVSRHEVENGIWREVPF